MSAIIESKRFDEVEAMLKHPNPPIWLLEEVDNFTRIMKRKPNPRNIIIWLFTEGLRWRRQQDTATPIPMSWRKACYREWFLRLGNPLIAAGFAELLDYHGHEHILGTLIENDMHNREFLENRPWYLLEGEPSFKNQSALHDASQGAKAMADFRLKARQ